MLRSPNLHPLEGEEPGEEEPEEPPRPEPQEVAQGPREQGPQEQGPEEPWEQGPEGREEPRPEGHGPAPGPHAALAAHLYGEGEWAGADLPGGPDGPV